MGGFLSRIPQRRIDDVLMDPVFRVLAVASEKEESKRRPLTADEEGALLRSGPAFIRDNRIGFVVVDRMRTTPAFEALVVKAFQLRHVETNDSVVLYSPEAVN